MERFFNLPLFHYTLARFRTLTSSPHPQNGIACDTPSCANSFLITMIICFDFACPILFLYFTRIYEAESAGHVRVLDLSLALGFVAR
jgi:hypothetical protein